MQWPHPIVSPFKCQPVDLIIQSFNHSIIQIHQNNIHHTTVLKISKGDLCLKTRMLGKNGPQVSQVGLGCMGMSDLYGSKQTRDDKESLATINLVVEAGINFFDTADYYGMGHNELLLREAMKGRRDKFFLSVKFGALRGLNGEFTGTYLRPAAVKNFVSYTLQSCFLYFAET